MALPLFRAPLSALPLIKDRADKYEKLIMSGKLGEELNKAYEYVGSLKAMVPAGITVATMELADVKKKLDDKQEGVMFSGTLSQLVVGERAQVIDYNRIDVDRIGYVIRLAHTDVCLKSLLGFITVHIGEGEQLRVMRANEGEVDALRLLMFWHSSNSQVLERLIAVASDLVFLGRRLRAVG